MSGMHAQATLVRLESLELRDLLSQARDCARSAHGNVVSHSRKVFIPLTKLCRDSCSYCTFSQGPRQVPAPYLAIDEVLAIARAGAARGCREALFTLGDRPEARYRVAREALESMGFSSTAEYVGHACRRVIEETGLLPHVNAGVLSHDEMAALRAVSVSQGLMLESASERLCARGGPHHGCPDKQPRARLGAIEAAGRLAIPFTTGILIGIGETRLERIEALLAIRDLHERYGHVQEVIVQNFRAKPATRMAQAVEPAFDELLWTAAASRLVLGGEMNIQVPPNLSDARYPELLRAGINDWGGISPVTPDHVNPEAAWPQLDALERETAARGYELVERLAVYPAYVSESRRWLDPSLASRVAQACDSAGFAREDRWICGEVATVPRATARSRIRDRSLDALLGSILAGDAPGSEAIIRLFEARGSGVDDVCAAADALRRAAKGDTVTYVVNRNINYTNVCGFACRFCAFSKGTPKHGRDGVYDLSLDEVARRAAEAWDRGATEVCMQGGIHPAYTGEKYLSLLRAAKEAAPRLHVHAFSPLEISHGAASMGLTAAQFLERLQAAGLGSLPGTAAEVLDDDVRRRICPDKLDSAEWLHVVESAHAVGLRTTATLMFGHVEHPATWATHLIRLRDLQRRTGGFTEFVPLPFVHMEAPLSLRGEARHGPTWREVRLVHAVARLALHPILANVQASWTKIGPANVATLLEGGVNDLGGTLMNESISRAAGASHGQELAPASMEALIATAGRTPRQRTTLYGTASAARRAASFDAAPLAPPVQTPLRRRMIAHRVSGPTMQGNPI